MNKKSAPNVLMNESNMSLTIYLDDELYLYLL